MKWKLISTLPPIFRKSIVFNNRQWMLVGELISVAGFTNPPILTRWQSQYGDKIELYSKLCNIITKLIKYSNLSNASPCKFFINTL